MVVIGQGECIRAEWLYSVRSCCIREKVVEFGQNLLYLGKSGLSRKLVVFAQKV